MKRLLPIRLILLLLLLLAGGSATAHSMPQSLVMLDFLRDEVAVELTLPLNEMELGFKQPLVAGAGTIVERLGPQLESYVLEHIHPIAPDGREWTVEFIDQKVVSGEAQPDLLVHLAMHPPSGAPLREFTLDYSIICHEVMSHCAIVSVRNDWNSGTFSNKPQVLGMIQYTVTSVMVDQSKATFWQGFRSVMALGMRHIAGGPDHLLFLFVLLLPAPLVTLGNKWGGFGGMRPAFLRLLKVVTAFTIGHSLTLVIGGMGWLQLPAKPVEILIAVSILVSAIHAIRPWFAGREPWVAGIFGLVHGLAFAGTIKDHGFSPWYMAMTVLGFNIGIELMQLAMVLFIVPSLILLSRGARYRPLRLTGAGLASLAALFWISQRL